jgi:hypothetical protein
VDRPEIGQFLDEADDVSSNFCFLNTNIEHRFGKTRINEHEQERK